MATQRKPNGLNDIENRFLTEYLLNGANGTLAYLKARPELVSKANATVRASELLSKPHIKKELEYRQSKLRINDDISLSYIVGELKTIIEQVKLEGEERDEKGRLTFRPDRKSALMAISQLCKLAGLETKNIDITSNGETILSEINVNIIKPKE